MDIDVDRAIVLGGGGVTGIAWEVGVLAGLRDAGVDLGADVVLGTSAGSFVGTALAADTDWGDYLRSQHEDAPDEVTTTTPPDLYQAWAEAYRIGAGDPLAVGRAMGAVALGRTALVSLAARQRAVEHRLATLAFPPVLRVAVQDADTGETIALRAGDGYPLAEVVSASGAVPGISPVVALGSRRCIDGGMVSSTNVALVEPCRQVLVVAPLPRGNGGLPSVADEVASAGGAARRWLVVPDEISREAIGSNIYDASRRGRCADAGLAQGRREGAALLRDHPDW